MLKYPIEQIIYNLLTILTSKKNVLSIEKQLLQKVTIEIGISQELYVQLHDKWSQSDHEIAIGNSQDENFLLLAFLIAGAYFDNRIVRAEVEILVQAQDKMGFRSGLIDLFIENHKSFDFSGKITTTILEIRNTLRQYNTESNKNTFQENIELPLVKIKEKKSEESQYICTQMSDEGVDELQALYLCAKLNLNTALSGPPGVGKTEIVHEMASILEIPLYTKVCSSRTTESHIISHPILEEQNGVTVTGYEDGPLCLAMRSPGIFYGDEYNLLREDVQKRLNSAFDDRRSIDRNDGAYIKAEKGFFSVISYNPTQILGQKDLDDSVADRFVHFHFSEWSPEMKAYISHIKVLIKQGVYNSEKPSFNDFRIKLEKRGFGPKGEFLLEEKRGRWIDFWTKKIHENIQPVYTYQVIAVPNEWTTNSLSPEKLASLEARAFDKITIANSLAKLVHIANEMADRGTSKILKQLKLTNFEGIEEMEVLSCHKASTRIITAALQHFHLLIKLGWNRYLAQKYAVRLVINQLTYGVYRNQKHKEYTTIEVLQTIAEKLGFYISTNINDNSEVVKVDE